MCSSLDDRCVSLVERIGLASSDAVRSVEALTGGVASDIAVVDVGDRRVAVKFALEKLRVAEDWHAPVKRNSAEYAWLEFAGDIVPGSVPTLFGRDADLNGFAMDFLEGADVYLWKAALLGRRPNQGEAAKVGQTLGRIHAASTLPRFDADAFQNQGDFYDLRLEPYLAFTATAHPDLADALQRLIVSQQGNLFVLIHGDVSPKNILFRSTQPVFLDAECATVGDPSFDVAFCLTHLLLKSFHMPDRAGELLGEAWNLWAGYAEHITWEDASQLESRVCELLPALMLGRIDGKSPVEYLSDESRARVREFAIPFVTDPTRDLAAMLTRVRDALEG